MCFLTQICVHTGNKMSSSCPKWNRAPSYWSSKSPTGRPQQSTLLAFHNGHHYLTAKSRSWSPKTVYRILNILLNFKIYGLNVRVKKKCPPVAWFFGFPFVLCSVKLAPFECVVLFRREWWQEYAVIITVFLVPLIVITFMNDGNGCIIEIAASWFSKLIACTAASCQ